MTGRRSAGAHALPRHKLLRRIAIGLGMLAVCLAVLFVLGIHLARAWLAEPGVPAIQSVSGELGAHRILLVFAHPDDEILATELIHRAVNEGAVVALITATRGNRGKQFPELVDQRHLGLVRAAESYKHGWALGITDQKVLDLGDQALSNLPPEALIDVIADEISRLRPDLVVTFHPETGVTMHGDHLAVGRAVVMAGKRASALGEVNDLRVAYVLAPRKGLRHFGGAREQEVARLQPEPDFVLRADESLKRNAWRIHESQAGLVKATTGLPTWLAYKILPFEYYAIEPL